MVDEDFEEVLNNYLKNVEDANSESTMGMRFLNFLQRSYDSINSGKADKLLPYLEEYVKTEKSTIAVKGRIDARMGNAIIEFKLDLDNDLKDAKSQLRRYITAIWNEEDREQKFYLIASDGRNCRIFIAQSHRSPPYEPEDIELDPVDSFEINGNTPEKTFFQLDRYFLYSEEIPATAENISRDFGPESPVYKESLEIMEDAWKNSNSQNIEVLYEEWSRYLEIVHGSDENTSKELFLRHTYLSIVAKLMAYIRYSGSKVPKEAEIEGLITGETFESWGIENFVEKDFFSWITRVETQIQTELINEILSRLKDYEFTDLEEDVLKELYQNLVTQEERHSLGEYYTPTWLVEDIVEKELDNDSKSSVLDPACGSGTFLFKSIDHKRENLELKENDLLNHMLENVVGIDINPLAVTIARVNYLLALDDTIKDANSSISIPVYLANSVKPPQFEMSTKGEDVYRFKPKEVEATFEIPATVGEDSEFLNELLLEIDEYLSSSSYEPSDLQSYLSKLQKFEELSDQKQSIIIENIAGEMKRLEKENKDTIWNFILKNVYKPIFLQSRDFDKILGNPPWLPLRMVNSEEYQNHIRNLMSTQYELIESGDRANYAHIELSALFFSYCMDNYLAEDGDISFVMPRSVFNGDHFQQFRQSNFIQKSSFNYIWDLKDVKGLFNNLSCVVSSRKTDGDSFPLPGKEYKGNVDAGLPDLEIAEHSYYLNKMGSRTVISKRKIDPEMFNEESYYEKKIDEGATIVPRAFWFIEVGKHPKLGIDPQEPLVRSSDRAVNRAKDRWEGIKMKQKIESEYIFRTITGSEMVYFTTLDLPLTVLPAKINSSGITLLNKQDALREGSSKLHGWLEKAENLWQENIKDSNDKSLLERIDFNNGDLEDQDIDKKFTVLQNHSGSKVHGAVVSNEDLESPEIEGQEIKISKNDNGNIPLIVDAKCYYYKTNSEKEAYYLSGFLNSPSIFDLIKEMLSRGNFGRRDVHKNVWEVKIPEFDSQNDLHLEISELAKEAEKKSDKIVEDLIEDYSKPLSPGSLGSLRTKQAKRIEPIRSKLSDKTLEALDEASKTQTQISDH